MDKKVIVNNKIANTEIETDSTQSKGMNESLSHDTLNAVSSSISDASVAREDRSYVNTPVNNNLSLEHNINTYLTDNLIKSMLVLNKDYDLTDANNIKALALMQKDVAEYLNDNFANNMLALKKYYKDLYLKFENYKPKTGLEFFSLATGEVNLYLDKVKSTYYPSASPVKFCRNQVSEFLANFNTKASCYVPQWDPFGQIHFRYVNEVALAIRDLKLETNPTLGKVKFLSNCILLGVGLGYVVGELYSQCEIVNMTIVEPDSDLFYASLYTFDWASLFNFIMENHYGLNLIIDSSIENTIANIGDYYRRHGTFLTRNPFIYMHYSNDVSNAYADALIHKMKTLNYALGFIDDKLFAISHGMNALVNGKHLVKRDHMLDGIDRTVPVFIVANGPSLDNDIKFLQKNQDKALIVASGTALDTLYNAGVKPDFYVSLERTNLIIETLEAFNQDNFFDDIVLITSDTTHPSTYSLFRREIVFGKTDEPLYWLFLRDKKYYDFLRSWGDAVLINPLVANFSISAFLSLGFTNLYFFGVDNGKRCDNNKAHASMSILYHAKNSPIKEQNIQRRFGSLAQANFGGEVETNFLFSFCADSIERSIDFYKKQNHLINCINCSDGMYLEHTKGQRSYDLDFTRYNDFDKKALVDKVYANALVPTFSKNDFLSLFSVREFDAIVDKIIKRVKSIQGKDASQVVLIMQDISEYLQSLKDGIDKFYSEILDGSIQTFFVQIQYLLQNCEDRDKAFSLVNFSCQRLIYMLQDSKSLMRLVPDYVMGEHLALLDGNVGFDHDDDKAPQKKVYSFLKDDDLEKLKAELAPFKKRYE